MGNGQVSQRNRMPYFAETAKHLGQGPPPADLSYDIAMGRGDKFVNAKFHNASWED